MKNRKFGLKRILFLCVLILTLSISIGALVNNNLGKNKTVKAATITAYNQYNNTWSSLYYGGRSVGATGCGILSLTNGINYYRPMAYSDVHTCVTDVASHAYSTGDFNGAYGGTMVAYFTKFSNSWAGKKYKVTGGTSTYWSNAYNTNLINHLKKENTFAVANVYGHYICLVDYDETKYDSYNGEYGKFLVLDSYQMVAGTAGGRVYWIGTPGGVNWASRHQLSYRNDRSYWYNLGYSSSTYHSGLQNANVITNFHLFTIEPTVIKETVTTKTNTVLGNTLTQEASKNWNLDNVYDTSNTNFNNRKAVISTFDGENPIYFNQSDSTQLKVGATFKTTGKADAEQFGKFGIGFFNSSNKGLWVYVDAYGSTGTSTSSITGRNVAIVKKTGQNKWDWKTSTNYDIATGVYSPYSPINLEIERNGVRFDIYINGNLIETINGLDYDLQAHDKIHPCILTFNIKLEVSNYYSIAKHNSISIDGSLEDWQTLSNWDEINANKKQAIDTLTNKKVVFYTRWTQEGLFVYAQAKHNLDSRNVKDWWKNTNFELFVDSNKDQCYVNHALAKGFDSFYFKTSGTSGNYTSILEGFISHKDTFNDGIKIGFAFKIESEGGIADTITQTGGSATSYWCPENTTPSALPYSLEQEYINTQNSAYSMIGEDGIHKNNNTLVFDNFTGERDIYFNDFANQNKTTLKATFKVTGKQNDEVFGKIGLSYIDEWGDGFFFYVNAEGSIGTSLSSITGTSIGLVRTKSHDYLWNDALSFEEISHTSAIWDKNKEFTLSIVRDGLVYKLQVNGITVHTINNSEDYALYVNQSIYPSIRSFNVYANVTNYGLEKTKIDGIITDSNLQDWETLNVWDKINSNACKIIDSTDSNKNVTFYSLLTKNGLHLAVKAHHKVNSTGYWTEWWKNTNVEFFIGVSSYQNQFFATELLSQGFTYSSFVTTGTSGNYTTIFEGFISLESLTHIGAFNGDTLKIGYAFKVDNLDNVKDEITINGNKTSYWCVDNVDPLLLNNKIYMESESVEESIPDVSINPEPEVSTSTPNSTQSSENSNQTQSSENSSQAQSSETSTQNTHHKNKDKGCDGSISSLTLLLPLAIFVVAFINKKNKNI